MSEQTYIEYAYQNMIKLSSSQFREIDEVLHSQITKESFYNEFEKSRRKYTLQKWQWCNRMESIVPALKWLKDYDTCLYEELYKKWCYYYNTENSLTDKAFSEQNKKLNITRIDWLINKFVSSFKDSAIGIGEITNKLYDLLYEIYEYKMTIEEEITKIVLEDWKTRLTKCLEIKIGEEVNNYSVIGSAIPTLKTSLAPDLKRPVFSCSLLTNFNYNTYLEREVGYIYNIKAQNLVGMCCSDASAGYFGTDKNSTDLIIAVLNAYTAVDYDTYEQVSWFDFSKVLPYEIMVSNTKSYNEIRLLSEEIPIGIFCKESAVDERIIELKAASYIYSLPVYSIGDCFRRIV